MHFHLFCFISFFCLTNVISQFLKNLIMLKGGIIHTAVFISKVDFLGCPLHAPWDDQLSSSVQGEAAGCMMFYSNLAFQRVFLWRSSPRLSSGEEVPWQSWMNSGIAWTNFGESVLSAPAYLAWLSGTTLPELRCGTAYLPCQSRLSHAVISWRSLSLNGFVQVVRVRQKNQNSLLQPKDEGPKSYCIKATFTLKTGVTIHSWSHLNSHHCREILIYKK